MSIIEYIISDIFIALLWESTEVVAMVVFLSNTLTIWLPNTSRNKYFQKFLNLMNRLSLNLHRNLNAADHVFRRQQFDDDQSAQYRPSQKKKKQPKPPSVKGSDD